MMRAVSESHENRQESFKDGNKRIGQSACAGDGLSLNDENVSSSSERALRKSERGSERGVEKEGERGRKAGKMMRKRRRRQLHQS